MKVPVAFVAVLLCASQISGASAKENDTVDTFLTNCAKESAVNSDCGVDVAAANLNARANKTGACPPKITRTEISDVVQWLNVRPNTRNMPVFDGLDGALNALYPCRKSE